MHGGRPAIPMSGHPAGTAGDAGLCRLLFALGLIPASTRCQLKPKPKQAQPEQCQGTGSVGKGGGGEEMWLGGLTLRTQGACAAKMLPALGCTDCRWAQRLAVGFFLWCPVRYLCQASVNLWCCSLGTNALLQVCSLVSCYSDIS